MTSIPVVILAGGRATRMGGVDKCLLPLAGAPLLTHILRRIGQRPVVLNANGDPERFAAFSLPVIPDSAPDYPGPLAGILAGMDWAKGQGATHVISVAGDTPFFPDPLCTEFEARSAEGSVLMAASREPDGRLVRQPAFGIWPISLRDDLQSALHEGVRKVVIWAERHPFGTVDFGDSTSFFNINHPADLEQAEGMAGVAG